MLKPARSRSPKDKFIVKDALTENAVNCNDFNLPVDNKNSNQLYAKMMAYLQEKEIWVRDCYACAEPGYTG